MFNKKRKMIDTNPFIFNLGEKAKDKITGFEGVIIARFQWLSNCNTYKLQPTNLDKDGVPQKGHIFDQPEIELVEEEIVIKESRKTGGPEREVTQNNIP